MVSALPSIPIIALTLSTVLQVSTAAYFGDFDSPECPAPGNLNMRLMHIPDFYSDRTDSQVKSISRYGDNKWSTIPFEDSTLKLQARPHGNFDTYPVPIRYLDSLTLNSITDAATGKVLTKEGVNQTSFSPKAENGNKNQTWTTRGVALVVKGSYEISYVYQLQIPGTNNCLASNALQGDTYVYQTPLLIRPCGPGPNIKGKIDDLEAPKSSDEEKADYWLEPKDDTEESRRQFDEYMKTLWLFSVADSQVDGEPNTYEYCNAKNATHISNYGNFLQGYINCLSSFGFLEACTNDSKNPYQRFIVNDPYQPFIVGA
ncbi:hypothetical protein BJ684DRAFT_20898 [Piptocephalis cylindrospora]|uniref:Uncharacterized protein n=1 Tax=Piptocephalis cylindrospora TaxID=1907219 RepID=A0A4P9Y419_9FUNG|nr:hypothetical protein BJ684DRAFT_20898 [Piptocephalis cylindrospora]|eukprot:RKP12570.1 hypothetical protein BJ684DRAFT_20898 [Piptocephalis cylindrospora]